MRVAPTIVLSEDERTMLTKLSKSKTTSVRLARRAKIVLLAAQGMDNAQIAAAVGVGRVQVGRWRQLSACVGLYYRRHQIALRGYVLPTFRMLR